MIMRILLIAALLAGLADCADRVLLKDVTAITLTDGAKTNGRRSSPVPQLTCTGGSAYGSVDLPKIVQCKNVGFDGADVQWECKAELDTRVKFGRLSVSCEGYNHPDDPYVLRGSCGLEYDLDWKSGSGSGYSKKSTTSESFLTYAAIAFIICVVIYMVYNAQPAGPGQPDQPGFRRFGSGFDHGPGGPPGGGGGHPGYPGSGPPPGYNDLFGKGSSSGSSSGGQANDGPGFWTGAGLGALGGYFMGRQQNQYGGGPRYRGSEYQRSTGFFSSAYDDQPSTSGSSSGTTTRSTATGYGGTTRR